MTIYTADSPTTLQKMDSDFCIKMREGVPEFEGLIAFEGESFLCYIGHHTFLTEHHTDYTHQRTGDDPSPQKDP